MGHTTGIVVMLGILVSYLLHSIGNQDDEKQLMKDLNFNEKLFFDLVLPLIIFPSGYNMRRKKFFNNIGTIMKFGFFGTMICFSIYTAMTFGVLQYGFLTKTDEKGEVVPLTMEIFEVLSICSLLCSSDVIAAISMINYTD